MSRCARSGGSPGSYSYNFDFRKALLKRAKEILVAAGAIENDLTFILSRLKNFFPIRLPGRFRFTCKNRLTANNGK